MTARNSDLPAHPSNAEGNGFPFQCWTDYPLFETEHGQIAPIRQVEVLDYDGDKYCHVRYWGEIYEVKRGYLYQKRGRVGEVPSIGPLLHRRSEQRREG